MVSRPTFKGFISPKEWRKCGKELIGKKIPEKNMVIKEIKKVVTSPTLKAIIKDADIRPIPIKGIEL